MIFSLLNLKTILLIACGGIIPSLFWLWFWLKEDRRRPEPKWIILLTFLAGGLMVVPALYLEQRVSTGFDLAKLENVKIDFSNLALAWKLSKPLLYIFFCWALIEESVKYIAARFTALRSRQFDEPVDAMIYMITAALGFAAVENSLFLLKVIRMSLSGFDFLINGNLRFLGASLIHILSSALVGSAIALAYRMKGVKRLWAALAGIMLAAVLHALFNFFIIINSGESIFRILVTLWIFVIFIIILFEIIKKIKIPYVQR